MVILVSGLPGSGKSYFARNLANELQFEYVNSDILRKEMFPERTYSEEEKLLVYRKMKEAMIQAIKNKRSIILDATFYSIRIRQEFSDIASAAGEPVAFIYVHASEETIRKRVSCPRMDSEADWEVYQKVKQEFEPLKEEHLELVSEIPVDEMIIHAKNYLRSRDL